MFSQTSNVTVVLTSCGRFDLLKKTLDSFFDYNTYPIRSFILVEDSGYQTVAKHLPVEHRENIRLIINEDKLGQIASIDSAYQLVETDYIFHCEDDWLFYRPGFIEDSMKVLDADKKCIAVSLRSYHHDFKNYLSRPAQVSHKNRREVAGVGYYVVDSVSLTFNPGLRRKKEYPQDGYRTFVHKEFLMREHEVAANKVELAASKFYMANGYYLTSLENDATKHIGGDVHIGKPTMVRRKILAKRIALVILIFSLCWVIGH